jgi:hypothetical protein
LPRDSPASSSTVFVRQLLYGNYPRIYQIYYQIVGTTVEIMHIRHGTRRQATRRELLR